MDRDEIIKQCRQAIDSGKPVESYQFYYSVINLLTEQSAVRIDFPFSRCANCKSVRPYTEKECLFSYGEPVAQTIVVGCENEQQCKVIYEMLKNGGVRDG